MPPVLNKDCGNGCEGGGHTICLKPNTHIKILLNPIKTRLTEEKKPLHDKKHTHFKPQNPPLITVL